MAFRNILVPYDGSVFSTRAFNSALSIAKKHQSKITILTCIGKEDFGSWYIDKKTNKQIMRDVKNFVKTFLLELEKNAKKSSIPIYTIVLETKAVAKQIVEFAHSDKIDLIVMGSHGRSGFNEFLLGSVSTKVSQMSKCPVLIIK